LPRRDMLGSSASCSLGPCGTCTAGRSTIDPCKTWTCARSPISLRALRLASGRPLRQVPPGWGVERPRTPRWMPSDKQARDSWHAARGSRLADFAGAGLVTGAPHSRSSAAGRRTHGASNVTRAGVPGRRPAPPPRLRRDPSGACTPDTCPSGAGSGTFGAGGDSFVYAGSARCGRNRTMRRGGTASRPVRRLTRRAAANQSDQPASERMSTRHGLQLVGCM
jgi:hypothetical protein